MSTATETRTSATATPGNGAPVPVKLTPQQELRGLLDKAKANIALALPKHLTAERMIRMAITAFTKTPELQKCSLLSIVGCVVQASELGLELSGVLGEAYMVPYWNKTTQQKEAQFQVGYRGFIALAYRSGKVQTFNGHVVYKNDKFRFAYGSKPILLHEPTLNEPGEAIAAYAMFQLTSGASDFEVMSKVQIDAHQKRYSKQNPGSDFNPWNTAWDQMAIKTPIRRLSKRAPMSVELVRAAVIDEYNEAAIDLMGQLPADMPAPPEGRTLYREAPPGAETPPLPEDEASGGDKPRDPSGADPAALREDRALLAQETLTQAQRQIDGATTDFELGIAGKTMTENRDLWGEEAYEGVLAHYQAKKRKVEAKAAKKKPSAGDLEQ
jgi:recombination protein RecT